MGYTQHTLNPIYIQRETMKCIIFVRFSVLTSIEDLHAAVHILLYTNTSSKWIKKKTIWRPSVLGCRQNKTNRTRKLNWKSNQVFNELVWCAKIIFFSVFCIGHWAISLYSPTLVAALNVFWWNIHLLHFIIL